MNVDTSHSQDERLRAIETPESLVKNGEERLVVLNRIAASVIEEARGEH